MALVLCILTYKERFNTRTSIVSVGCVDCVHPRAVSSLAKLATSLKVDSAVFELFV